MNVGRGSGRGSSQTRDEAGLDIYSARLGRYLRPNWSIPATIEILLVITLTPALFTLPLWSSKISADQPITRYAATLPASRAPDAPGRP